METQQDPPPPPSLPSPPPSQLSFAYSRMKKLGTSKAKHTNTNTKAPSCADGDGQVSSNQNLAQNGQQQQLRKQVRRRITNRPYPERLLNMAEARKEIVTALKYHRATTKLANDHQQLQRLQQHQSLSFQPSLLSRFSPDGRFKARRRPKMLYPPSSNKMQNYLNDFSFSTSFPPLPPLPPPPLPHPHPPVPNFYPNTITSPFAYPPPKPDTPNFALPSQALGFNLNLHRFDSVEPTLLPDDNILDPTLLLDNNILDSTPLFNNNNILDSTPLFENNSILEPTLLLENNNFVEPTLLLENNSSSLSSYSSPTLSCSPFVTDQDVPSIGMSQPQSQGEGVSSVMNTTEPSSTTQASGSMHVAMDEEGMEEIRALGQQHQMEWDDTMSFVTSVWWFDCLQQMENNALEVNGENVTSNEIFDDELEFPIWEN